MSDLLLWNLSGGLNFLHCRHALLRRDSAQFRPYALQPWLQFISAPAGHEWYRIKHRGAIGSLTYSYLIAK